MEVLTHLLDHLEHRDASSLARLRHTILSDATFDVASPWFEPAAELAAQERHDELIRLLDAHMPGAFLSPEAHQLLAHALTAIGERTQAEQERFLAHASLELILDSGDGSQTRPWQVLEVLDEYAVLRHHQVSVASQRRDVDGARTLDVHRTSAGRELWFEVLQP
ncbi:DUF4919 domain-containing protein [uncultured Tessaracoccus sp.]|uniref:DUF4919 domain-containing protein n=1 Tax=uncultured Tessaracoccus sp. TaxID=905023 RepID=UPI002630F8ED|nr:DUF4919 domain-containing protein [uncultured Tessaracoccus sp.]